MRFHGTLPQTFFFFCFTDKPQTINIENINKNFRLHTPLIL